MKPNRFPFLVAALLLLPSLPSLAREITAEEAVRAAEAWVRRDSAPLETRLGSATAAAVRTVRDDANAPLFHIVRMEGGGVVVTSAESGITPVIAFLDGDDVEEDARNPLWALLNKDLASRNAAVAGLRNAEPPSPAVAAGGEAVAKAVVHDALSQAEAAWGDLLANAPPVTETSVPPDPARASSIPDIRVGPLVQSQWDQSLWGGYSVFNYYTPPYAPGSTANYPCGCTATAFAQIMRYWQYPESTTAGSYACSVDGVATTLKMKGGTYDWNSMPLTVASCTTDAQRQAIGKLTYDIGVAAGMSYRSNAAGGSSVAGRKAAAALRNQFGYGSAKTITRYPGTITGNISANESARNAVLASLDAGMPTTMSMTTSIDEGGHHIVVDGYGYSGGTLYCHVNAGWGNGRPFENVWYNLIGEPITENYPATMLYEINYNIHPTLNSCDVLSGRVVDASGTPLSGASVTIITASGTEVTTQTKDTGIYAFIIYSAAEYGLRATYGDSSSYRTVTFSSIGKTADEYSAGTVGNKWGVDFVLDLSGSASSAPSAPTGITAMDGVSTDVVTVLWNASSGASSYSIFRHTSNSSGSATCIAFNVPNCLFYDESAVPGTVYYYWVKAVNSAGSSGFSASDTGWRKLSAPTISTATGSTTGVALSWSASTGATHYRVFRATSSSGTKTALGSWQTGRTYTDTTGTAGTTYYYFIQAAVNSSGTRPSDYSAYRTGVKTKDGVATFTTFTPSGTDRFTFAFTVKQGLEYHIQWAQTLDGPWGTAETITPSESGTIGRVITFPASWKSGFVRVTVEE